MSMKVYAKSKSDHDAQQFKFKPRAFQIESIMELEIPALANSSATEAFSDWKEFTYEEKSADNVRLIFYAQFLLSVNWFHHVYISNLKWNLFN